MCLKREDVRLQIISDFWTSIYFSVCLIYYCEPNELVLNYNLIIFQEQVFNKGSKSNKPIQLPLLSYFFLRSLDFERFIKKISK